MEQYLQQAAPSQGVSVSTLPLPSPSSRQDCPSAGSWSQLFPSHRATAELKHCEMQLVLRERWGAQKPPRSFLPQQTGVWRPVRS